MWSRSGGGGDRPEKAGDRVSGAGKLLPTRSGCRARALRCACVRALVVLSNALRRGRVQGTYRQPPTRVFFADLFSFPPPRPPPPLSPPLFLHTMLNQVSGGLDPATGRPYGGGAGGGYPGGAAPGAPGAPGFPALGGGGGGGGGVPGMHAGYGLQGAR